MPQGSLAALVVKKHDVICLHLNVISHYLRTSFAEGLDDLRRLRTSTARHRASECSSSSAALGSNGPRLAIGNKNPSSFRIGADLRILLGQDTGQPQERERAGKKYDEGFPHTSTLRSQESSNVGETLGKS